LAAQSNPLSFASRDSLEEDERGS